MWFADRSRVVVGLAAHQVVLLPVRKVWPGPLHAPVVRDCAADGGTLWHSAVAALTSALGQLSWRPRRVRVVLSERFVRWQLLPWRDGLGGASEYAAYARHHFQSTYGPAAENWLIQLALRPPGHAVPSCAIDAALLEALQAACASVGASVDAVVPHFVDAFDHYRRRISSGATAFGLIEEDGLSLAVLRGGQWLSLHTQRTDGDPRVALPGMLARASVEAAIPLLGLQLVLAGGDAAPVAPEGLQMTWLQPRQTAGALARWHLATA